MNYLHLCDDGHDPDGERDVGGDDDGEDGGDGLQQRDLAHVAAVGLVERRGEEDAIDLMKSAGRAKEKALEPLI